MTTFFLACAALGGVMLLLQLVFSLAGADHGASHELHDGHDTHHGEGLHLFSVRALSAGLAFFGFGGLVGLRFGGVGALVAFPMAVVLGIAALVGVSWATRAMLRLEDDGTLDIQNAVGTSGDVYLSIPAHRAGAGKVHLTVQNRLVELQAVTSHHAAIPTGSRILIVDVVGPDTVDVVPDPIAITTEVRNVPR